MDGARPPAAVPWRSRVAVCSHAGRSLDSAAGPRRRNELIASQDELIEALIRGLGFTHCRTPECQTLITPATVVVGYDNRPRDYAYVPVTWLTCTQCGKHIKSRDIPRGIVVKSKEEAINILMEA